MEKKKKEEELELNVIICSNCKLFKLNMTKILCYSFGINECDFICVGSTQTNLHWSLTLKYIFCDILLPAEAPLSPHQEPREGSLPVDPGRRGGAEIRTSGGDTRVWAHERHLVLWGRLHQEQGKQYRTCGTFHKVWSKLQTKAWTCHLTWAGLILYRVCVYCSCPPSWACRWWAT